MSIAREFSQRLAAAILMLAAALCGLAATISAFRNGEGSALRLFALFGFAASVGAEGVSLCAGRGLIYTVLFVGIFAAAVLLLNLRKE